jgi:hypothetical protein
MTIQQLADKIEAATDRNDHTGAVCLLADFVGGKYPKIAEAIRLIHKEVGSMPIELGKYRHELRNEMLFILSEKLPAEDYFKIKSSF